MSFNGRPLRIPRAKDRALLAYLVVQRGRQFTRETLADLLWSSRDERKGRHSLNQALYALKRALPGVIEVTTATVGVHSKSVTTDIHALTGASADSILVKELKGIGGEFLADLTALNPEFEEWRSNFNSDFFRRLDDRVSLALDRISPTELRTALFQLPPHLSDLLPSLRSVATLPPSVHLDPNRPSKRVTLPLVGRDDQVRELEYSFESAVVGNPTSRLIIGKPGFGKTRLANEFLARVAECDAKVIQARCYESDRRIGFAPIIQAIENSFSPEDLTGLPAIWTDTLHALIPSIPSTGTQLPELGAPASQARLFEAVRQLILHLATQQPLVLFLDDVQWCDPSTRSLIGYLAHRIEFARIMFMATIRERADGQLPEPWNEWEKVHVFELSKEDVELLLATSSTTRTSGAKQLHDATGGHPFLIAELIHRAARPEESSHAASIEEYVTGLLQTLPAAAQKVAAVLAVVGRPATSTFLSRVTPGDQIPESLDVLIHAGLATRTDRRVALRHDIVRQIAYARVPIFTRAEFHKRIGDALPRARVGERAEHYYKAGKRTAAYELAVQAVELAEAKHSTAEAIYFTRLAMRAKPHSTQLHRLQLAERLARAHKLAEARAELSHIMKVDAEPSIKIFDLELAALVGSVDNVTIANALADLKREVADARTLQRILRLELRLAYHEGDAAAIRNSIIDLRTFAARCAVEEDALLAETMAARAHASVFSALEARTWVTHVRERMAVVTDHETVITLLTYLSSIAYDSGDLKEAFSLCCECLNEIEAVGAINFWPLTAAHTHVLCVEQGDYGQATALADEIEKRSRNLEAAHHAFSELYANCAIMHFEMDDFAQAEVFAEKSKQLYSPNVNKWIRIGVDALRGLCLLERGVLSEAKDTANSIERELNEMRIRVGDTSHAEMLIARVNATCVNRSAAVTRLRDAIADYRDRDVVCRIRMQLELARLLKSIDKNAARAEAKQVYETARSINARPIAERADSLLLRL